MAKCRFSFNSKISLKNMERVYPVGGKSGCFVIIGMNKDVDENFLIFVIFSPILKKRLVTYLSSLKSLYYRLVKWAFGPQCWVFGVPGLRNFLLKGIDFLRRREIVLKQFGKDMDSVRHLV